MRRSAIAACTVFAGLISAGCVPKLVATRDAVPVTIEIKCEGESFLWSIDYVSKQIEFPDIIEWKLATTSTPNASFSINKKSGKGWPFGGDLPYEGKKDKPAKGDGVKDNAKGRYEYTITAICTPSSGATKTVVIDPDMIIIRGGTRPQ